MSSIESGAIKASFPLEKLPSPPLRWTHTVEGFTEAGSMFSLKVMTTSVKSVSTVAFGVGVVAVIFGDVVSSARVTAPDEVVAGVGVPAVDSLPSKTTSGGREVVPFSMKDAASTAANAAAGTPSSTAFSSRGPRSAMTLFVDSVGAPKPCHLLYAYERDRSRNRASVKPEVRARLRQFSARLSGLHEGRGRGAAGGRRASPFWPPASVHFRRCNTSSAATAFPFAVFPIFGFSLRRLRIRARIPVSGPRQAAPKLEGRRRGPALIRKAYTAPCAV